MRTSARTAVVAVATVVTVGLAAPPATAHHGHFCPGYVDDDLSPKEEFDIEAATIPLAIVHDGLDLLATPFKETAEKGVPIVSTIAGAVAFVIKVVMVTITSVIGGLNIAKFGLNVKNSIADGCKDDEHWLVEDHLITAAVRADLAVTTPPLAQLVLPSEGAGGLLDADGVGVQAVVARTIADLTASGQCSNCASAVDQQTAADAALARGEYKTAYLHYRRAYVAATG